MNVRSLCCLLFLAGLMAGRAGFATVAQAQTASTTPVVEEAKTVAYRLSRTDKISIAIIGEPDLNAANKRIDVNGNVNLALVQEVHIAGLTVTEAQAAIENAYRDGRILRNPQVTINIEEYAPRLVTVSGLVKFPGTINLPPETVMTLKDLLNKVQLAETANAKAVRISRPLPDGTTQIFTKNVDGILHARDSGKSADGDFVIEPGDTVVVPEKMF
jgi:polysaccharide biosynthesis/export protein